MSTRSRTQAVALLLTAFGVGAVAGGAALTSAIRNGKADFVFPEGRAPVAGNQGRQDWTRRIGLEGELRDTVMAISRRGERGIDSIVRGAMGSTMDSLWESVRPAVEARRSETRAQIRGLLSPELQVRYDSLTKANDENRRRMREQGRSGPGGQDGRGGGGTRGSR